MQLLWLIPSSPLIGFLLLLLWGRKLSPRAIPLIGVGSVGLAALVTVWVGMEFQSSSSNSIQLTLWHWFDVGTSSIGFSLYLDALSLTMSGVVTGVGFLIHWYAAAYMREDKSLARFFAYMNLFVCAMLLLVLADNLVLLYLGWEGVGLCSFLLIGFWYQQPENVAAAKKAFIVTRIGDTSLLIGLLLLFFHLGELNIQPLLSAVQVHWLEESQLVWWSCLLLLGGAVGKSAQLPLHTWLPDAMAGPTPVSALIHAATMVTAGVYLIARLFPLYQLSPDVMLLVTWVGLLTLLLAGFAAMQQSDLKRILAYSTMSQIGYMVLALGAGGWQLAIFHLMTHAFFKALLFLLAGTIILKHHHDQNIFNMGGIRHSMPLTCILFIIGLAGLTALPGTSGFFSKEAILNQVYLSATAGPLVWWLAVFGALITAVYSFRLLFIAFWGPARNKISIQDEVKTSPFTLPLLPLALLALIGGFIPIDLESVFGAPNAQMSPVWTHWLAPAATFIGIALAYHWFRPVAETEPEENQSSMAQFLRSGLGFDRLYHLVFTTPINILARWNKSDVIDNLYHLLAWFTQTWHQLFALSQNGRLRWYASGFLLGTIVVLGGVTWWP